LDNIVVVLILLIPGYVGLVLFEFFTGIQIKRQLTQHIFSIILGLIALLELNIFPCLVLYLNTHLITINSPVTGLKDPGVISLLIFLILLSFVSTIIFLIIKTWIEIFLKKLLKRSFDTNIMFTFLNEYIKKSTIKEPFNILLKLKSGNYLYGTVKRASDNMDEPYIYIIGGVELKHNYEIIKYFKNCKNRSEDGVLVNLKDCDFVGFGFTDECFVKKRVKKA